MDANKRPFWSNVLIEVLAVLLALPIFVAGLGCTLVFLSDLLR